MFSFELQEIQENIIEDQDDGNESDYSLDYEFPGPRYANFRSSVEDNDQASDLSDSEMEDKDAPRFDMWDDDPFNDFDFTWESVDMQLTKFIKRKQKEPHINAGTSFWKKEKGWPLQLPYSCSSTNHDQSANAICLVQSNYGASEQLYAVYRDRIVQCGNPPIKRNNTSEKAISTERDTTWLDGHPTITHYHQSSSDSACKNSKFVDAHQSVSIYKLHYNTPTSTDIMLDNHDQDYIKKFKPYTKYIKRSDYPGFIREEAYLPLGFEPQCLAQKYGYMAIGGVEGEFELYCCMNPEKPVKIWGTNFKDKDNVMLMTNAIQLVRFQNSITGDYEHMLIGCMNDAGLLFYHLPHHDHCKEFRLQQQENMNVQLHSHLRSFNGMPINDAKLSPDGTKLVCVGDESLVFMIDVFHCETTGGIQFGTPVEVAIPPHVFVGEIAPYSSQYVAWSPSCQYFANTSDSHNFVLIWRADTMKIVHQIDSAGYSYAISFHPFLDHILVFTNRYGYFHTIDLSNATSADTPNSTYNILNYATTTEYTRHLKPKHEITMVSFRGEIDSTLRILAKINGIEWSKDGRYLYLATKKRVLAFRFLMTCEVPSLLDISSLCIKKTIEREENSRKRKKMNSITQAKPLHHWSLVPEAIQSRVMGNTQQLACHW